MTNQTEQTYLNKVRSGDTKAFSYFVDTYQTMAFTLAVRIVKNREDAEDIVQEAFVKCFHSLHLFKGDSKFSTWLYRIVYHTALDAVRKQNRSPSTISMDKVDYSGISEVSGVLDQMFNVQLAAILKAAIEKLNPQQKTIITLYYYDCLSLKEIAEIVAMCLSTVKVNLFRARKNLYLQLKDHVEFQNRKS
jgi:RNA polymerase sigma-70 factor (ECF subfamily)